MKLKKKLGLSVAAAILGLGLIGGGTFAYFSDVEETNNSFAAGTLDIYLKGVDEKEVEELNIENMKPGDRKVHQIRVYNGGTLDIKDVKLTADYNITDAKGDNNGEDFADHIYVHIRDQNRDVMYDWIPLSAIKDLVIAEDLTPDPGRPYVNTDRQILYMMLEFRDNGEDQNIFQGDRIDFKLVFEASQKDGEYR